MNSDDRLGTLIDYLRELDRDSQPGPWVYDSWERTIVSRNDKSYGLQISQLPHDPLIKLYREQSPLGIIIKHPGCNGELIAALRNDLPMIIEFLKDLYLVKVEEPYYED